MFWIYQGGIISLYIILFFFLIFFFSYLQTDLSITGHLDVSVNFIHPNSLYLTIHRAEGLSLRRDGKPTHAFVKAAIPGTGTVHKTQVELFTFVCTVVISFRFVLKTNVLFMTFWFKILLKIFR